jgi:peptidoglycan/LPS O-acetylase OafA/YrhL
MKIAEDRADMTISRTRVNESSEWKPDRRIDLIRGVCILGVVGIHFGGSFLTQTYVWTGPFYVGLFLNQFFSFCVAVFVFLSGWQLDLRYGLGEVGILQFYRRRLIKIGLPYLIASLMYLYWQWEQQDWTAERVLTGFFYKGIQPILYFIPLMFQLYLIYPFLRLLANKTVRGDGQGKVGGATILLVLFALHLTLGHLSYSGKIDYYIFCRPFPLYWLFFFFGGMYFSRIRKEFSLEKYGIIIITLLVFTLAVLSSWNAVGLLDTSRVGLYFERNNTDMAYSRPEIMLYNIVWVLLTGILLSMKWSFRFIPIEWFGKFSFYIYLFHIQVLAFYVWGRPTVMEACKEYPGLILLIIALICLAIALPGQVITLTIRLVQSRLTRVEIPR